MPCNGRTQRRLSVEREAQIVLEIVVPREEPGGTGQLGQLLLEGVKERVHAAAVVHVAGAGVEHRVA